MSLVGTILVVDDHAYLAENLAEILEQKGHDVAVAASAEAALRRVQEGDVVAIVTDYRLPGLNGVEFIAELRRQGRRIPAVIMSGFTDDETIAKALAAGALDVLAKPVEIGRLFSVVEEMRGAGRFVLLAEDNCLLAKDLADILRSSGYVVNVRASVKEALSDDRVPDMAILDYRLSDGTGVEIAKRLRLRDPHLRVLFISGCAEDLERACTQLGSPARLEKPFDINRLLDWVRNSSVFANRSK